MRIALAATVAAAPARADLVLARLNLYEARTIVTGTDMRSRPSGFASCLRDVLVQVSGDPALLADARVATAARDAAGYVSDYSYLDRMSGIRHHDEQGSSDRPYYLTVRFEPLRIDALVAALGDRPWPPPRPALWAALHIRSPSAVYDLTSAATAGSARDQRLALAAAAERYAVPLALPPSAGSAPPRGALIATGSLTWSEAAHGWIGVFSVSAPGSPTRAWRVQGVSYDEAFRVLVRGAVAIGSGHTAALTAASLAP